MFQSKYSVLSASQFGETITVVTNPGKFKATVNNVLPKLYNEALGVDTQTIRFNAVTLDKVPQLKKLLNEGAVDPQGKGGKNHIAIETFSKLLVATRITKDADVIRGEHVDLLIEEVISKGLGNTPEGQKVLVVRDYVTQQAQKPRSFASFLTTEEEPVAAAGDTVTTDDEDPFLL